MVCSSGIVLPAHISKPFRQTALSARNAGQKERHIFSCQTLALDIPRGYIIPMLKATEDQVY
jgi:hypothetical protein